MMSTPSLFYEKKKLQSFFFSLVTTIRNILDFFFFWNRNILRIIIFKKKEHGLKYQMTMSYYIFVYSFFNDNNRKGPLFYFFGTDKKRNRTGIPHHYHSILFWESGKKLGRKKEWVKVSVTTLMRKRSQWTSLIVVISIVFRGSDCN